MDLTIADALVRFDGSPLPFDTSVDPVADTLVVHGAQRPTAEFAWAPPITGAVYGVQLVTYWIYRGGAPIERHGPAPDHVLATLADLAQFAV